jgi:hypothetical protein
MNSEGSLLMATPSFAGYPLGDQAFPSLNADAEKSFMAKRGILATTSQMQKSGIFLHGVATLF